MNLNAAVQELGQLISGSGVTVYSVFLEGDTPAAVIQPPDFINYDHDFGPGATVNLKVALFVSAADKASAFTMLYALLSYQAGTSVTSLIDLLQSTTSTNHIRQIKVNDARGFAYDENTNSLTVDLYLTLIL